MSKLLEWMKEVFTKAENNDFLWKPIYENNMPCNGKSGIYTDMFFEKNGMYQYRKFSIEYVSRCDSVGISHPEEGIRYYVLHLLEIDDLDETFEIPEPSDDYDILEETNANLVNDYGRFRYVFDDEETAKSVVCNELKQMIYPFTYILDKEESLEWNRFISMLYGEEEPILKVVYNAAVSGGLHLSDKAMDWLRERGMEFEVKSDRHFGPYVDIPRHNQLLVECIETLGEDANGPENGWTPKAEIQVATITGNYYYIDDHDGAGEEVIDIGKMINASE